MILDPINDEQCLDQLTRIARELAPTTLVQMVARRLRSADAVIRWLRSLPQADDDGHEGFRYIDCDVPQRVRLLPDDPNCVERATGAIMLLEVLDPRTPRALATIDRPLRHTGLVEFRSGHWTAVDLFPRRNWDWGNFGKDVLQGVHSYVGKPLLSFYGLGGAADQLGEAENKAIGRDGKKGGNDKKQPEKKDAPPAQQGKSDGGRQNPQPKPAGESGQKLTLGSLASVIGTGAKEAQSTKGGGAKDNGKEEANRAGAAAGSDADHRTRQAAQGNGRDPHDEGAQARRWWWSR